MKKPKFYRIFDYAKTLLPNKYLADLEENIATIEQVKKSTGFSVGYPGWNLIYYLLMIHLERDRFNHIVETGTNYGCTTIILAQAIQDSQTDGVVHTIEIDHENYQKAISNFVEAKLNHLVKPICGDSKIELPKIVNDLDIIRLAFLEGCHLLEDVIFEFETIYPKLSPGSIVIFDNTYLIAEPTENQRVNGALNYIHKHCGGQLINLEFVSGYTPGIAIWQK
ncbi:class I SAM-dependent methyltransferase [Microcoleus sp. K1-B6]|uniref:class I SAM-dependent methyltransferase n=1 Tax=unclassified Microcoleus TaxID=2642155 RepID=UPI002FD5EFBE